MGPGNRGTSSRAARRRPTPHLDREPRRGSARTSTGIRSMSGRVAPVTSIPLGSPIQRRHGVARIVDIAEHGHVVVIKAFRVRCVRQEAHDEHAFGMHADLHVRKITGCPTVGQLCVRQFLVVPRPKRLRACAFGLLNGHTHFPRRSVEFRRIDSRFPHHVLQIRIDADSWSPTRCDLTHDRHDHAAEAVGI